MDMQQRMPFPRSALAAAMLTLAVSAPPVFAQATPTDPPADTPVVVIEDRNLRERADDRNLTLAAPLAVVDGAGDPIVTLPAGTLVGRGKTESRFTADNQLIRQRTDLRSVTLAEAVTVNNRVTGESLTLPAGTMLRVKLDQRFDAGGNVVRDRIDLRAVLADGTKLRIRDRAPEIEVVDVENEVADRHRQRGRDQARSEGRSGSSGRSPRAERPAAALATDRAARVERAVSSGSGRPDRPERSERGDRGDRGDRSGRH